MKSFIHQIFGVSLLTGAVLGLAHPVFAQGRVKNKLGVSVGVLSDPFPSLLSYQLSYNATPWLRISASYGSISVSSDNVAEGGTTTSASLQSFGASAKAFVIPSWNLSPFIGASFAYAKGTGSVSISGESIASDDGSLQTIAGSFGIDHSSNLGFNVGAGVNYFLSPT